MTANHNVSARATQRGQALIEFTVVTLLVVIVLVARPNVVVALVDALRTAYQAFTYAISFT